MIDEIFDDLKVAIAKGKDLPVPEVPEVEDELKPFVIRPMTADEITLFKAADNAGAEARKMMARVTLLHHLGLPEEPTPERTKEAELLRFHATMLDDLFFWFVQANTGWNFAMLFQRVQEGRLVLVGLPAKEAHAYLKKEEEQKRQAAALEEKPGPRLVVN